MTELTYIKNEIIMCDSRVIADKFTDGKHHNVKTMIEKLVKQYTNIKPLIGRGLNALDPMWNKCDGTYRNRKFTYYEMNKTAFTLLVMRFKTTAAFEWQLKFTQSFQLMELALLRQGNLEWKKERKEGKQIRKDETTAIKQLVDLATSQGSKSANKYYLAVTKMTNKALGFIQQTGGNLRDTLDELQLSQLKLVEHRAMRSIDFHVNNDEHYKEVYVNVKNDVLKLANELIGFQPLLPR